METALDNINMFVLLKTETNDYAKHMGKRNMNTENGDKPSRKMRCAWNVLFHGTGEKSLITMGISNNFLLADISLEILDFHLTYLN